MMQTNYFVPDRIPVVLTRTAFAGMNSEGYLAVGESYVNPPFAKMHERKIVTNNKLTVPAILLHSFIVSKHFRIILLAIWGIEGSSLEMPISLKYSRLYQSLPDPISLVSEELPSVARLLV